MGKPNFSDEFKRDAVAHRIRRFTEGSAAVLAAALPTRFSWIFHGSDHVSSQVLENMVGAAGFEPATPPV